MKKIGLYVLSMILSSTILGQQNQLKVPAPEKHDYLKKSKTQKAVGWTLAASGLVACTIGGIAAFTDAAQTIATIPGSIITGTPIQEESNAGTGLIVAGSIAIVSSIPFFISGIKNKNKAMSISLRNQAIPYLHKNSFAARAVPSFSLKFSI